MVGLGLVNIIGEIFGRKRGFPPSGGGAAFSWVVVAEKNQGRKPFDYVGYEKSAYDGEMRQLERNLVLGKLATVCAPVCIYVSHSPYICVINEHRRHNLTPARRASLSRKDLQAPA